MLGPGKMPTDDDTAPARILPRSPGFILAIAMAVAVFACSGDLPEPAPTFPPLQTATPTTSPVLATQPSIEAVFSLVPSLPSGRPLRPLFGHLPKDREPIARLARALDAATPIAPDEHLSANDRGRYLDVRYRDGMKIAVRQVARCEPWTDADAKESAYVGCKGKWVRQTDTWWVEGAGMVKSAHLAQWWEEMTGFMVPIGSVGIPKTIKPGEPFKITLFSWDGVIDGDSVDLSLVSSDGAEIGLGAYPVSGTFQGQLSVPDQTPDGRYWLRVSAGSFSELVTIVHIE